MNFKPPESLSEQIADHLSEKIIRFELKPGERIIEEKISGEMGVSRSPIREALRILEKKWLVELIPRKEARVSTISEQMILSIGEILKELYGLVAQKAVKSGTPEEHKKIVKSLRLCIECAENNNRQEYYYALIKFEEACLKAAKNKVLISLMEDIWPYSRRVQYATLKLRTETLKDHVTFFKEALKCIEEGNGALAAKAIQELTKREINYGAKYINKFESI